MTRTISTTQGISDASNLQQISFKERSSQIDVLKKVRVATSTPITAGDMIAALEKERFWGKQRENVVALGAPCLFRRAKRHWIGGNYIRATACAVPGAVLLTGGLVSLYTWLTPLSALLNPNVRKPTRTGEGVWADRLAGTVYDYVNLDGQQRVINRQILDLERECLENVRKIVSDKPQRIRNSGSVYHALRDWQKRIDGDEKMLLRDKHLTLEEPRYAEALSLANRLQAQHMALAQTTAVSDLANVLAAAKALISEAETIMRTVPSSKSLVPALGRLKTRVGVVTAQRIF